MKKLSILLSFVALLLFPFMLQAQAPQKIGFQTTVYKNNQLETNGNVQFKVVIYAAGMENSPLYEGLFNAGPNAFGVVTVVLNQDETEPVQNFTSINWNENNLFISAIPVDNDEVHTYSQPQPITSVPYAFYASTANTVDNSSEFDTALAEINASHLASLRDMQQRLSDALAQGNIRPQGALNGTFSVAENRHVCFSQGNLQYTTDGMHEINTGKLANGTFRFGTNQYSYVGSGNSKIGENNLNNIDLFGWGTSGYNNKYPYLSSNTATYYTGNTLSNTNYDWGVYNAISNGNNIPGIWRTLTVGEWKYLFKERTNAENLWARGTVASVKGIILLPDDWQLPESVRMSSLGASSRYADNTYSSSIWVVLEQAGAVFLPDAGSRNVTTYTKTGNGGRYWAATSSVEKRGDSFRFDATTMNFDSYYRYAGRAVRLVFDLDYDVPQE